LTIAAEDVGGVLGRDVIYWPGTGRLQIRKLRGVQALLAQREQEYGRSLHTGVYFRDPAPRPTYDAAVRERRAALGAAAPSRRQVLDRFRPKA